MKNNKNYIPPMVCLQQKFEELWNVSKKIKLLEDLRKDHPHLPETSVFTIPENLIGSSYNNNIFNTFHESGISFMPLGNDIKRRRVAPQVYTITDIGKIIMKIHQYPK